MKELVECALVLLEYFELENEQLTIKLVFSALVDLVFCSVSMLLLNRLG